MAVAPNGVVYVNNWSGKYYKDKEPPKGGFIVALQDKDGDGVAETVDMRNRSQLSELEWKARQERNYRGGVYVIPGPASPADTPRRNR